MSEAPPRSLQDCAIADTKTFTVAVDCGGAEPGKITVTPSCLIAKPTVTEIRFQEQASDIYLIRYDDKSVCFDPAGKNCPLLPKSPPAEGGKGTARELIANVAQWRTSNIGNCDAKAAGSAAAVSGHCMNYAVSCLSQDTGVLSLAMASQPVIVLERPPALPFHPMWIAGIGIPVFLAALLLRAWWLRRQEVEEEAAPHSFKH